MHVVVQLEQQQDNLVVQAPFKKRQQKVSVKDSVLNNENEPHLDVITELPFSENTLCTILAV